MKIFISQPMRDKEESQILEERIRIQNYIDTEYKNVKYIESFIKGNDKKNPILSLSESIKYLSEADLVIFTKDWESARGCRIEHLICEEYGVDYKVLE